MCHHPRIVGQAVALFAGLAALFAVATADAETPAAFAVDFARSCDDGKGALAEDWRISGNLDPVLRPLRVHCLEGVDRSAGPQALRIEVHPGDAYDPNPDDKPTERVEMQLRHPLVRFEAPVWYSFAFRLVEPWPVVVNRTVIHQIKQNIEPRFETQQGGPCPGANPFFKIEAGGDASGAQFVAKTRGTADCRDGSPVPICGPWPLTPGAWHRVHVQLTASQRDGASDLRVWLDGRACPRFTGKLGYLDHGKRDADGQPIVDTQPRFGVYRDALPDTVQAIDFRDIIFWTSDPAGDPSWQPDATPKP